MESIANLIKNKQFKPVNKKAIKHEWQAFAYKVWTEYDKDPDDLPNIMRFFKTHNKDSRHLLDAAYNFCFDYAGKIPKIYLFYWKFWKLKKGTKGKICN